MDVQKTRELEAKVVSSPDDHQSRLELADIYIRAGELAKAYELVDELSQKFQQSIEIQTTAGGLATRLENYSAAIDHLEKALEISPDDRDIHHNLGLLYAAEEDTERAIVSFTKVTELDPQNAEGFNDLAVVLAHAEKTGEAIECFNKAIKLNPFYEKAYENLVEFCLSRKRFDEATEAVDSFLKLVPDDPKMKEIRQKITQAASLVESTEPGRPITVARTAETAKRGYKIAFFSTQNSFAEGILHQLSRNNEIRRFAGQNVEQFTELLRWADVAWFEWCDQLLIEATKLPKTCKIICRLHSYEAFTEMPDMVDWSKVDKLILVNENVEHVLRTFHNLPIKPEIIRNGVDINKFVVPQDKKYGKNICSLGYINYKKNPALLLYCFKAIHDWDPEFRFHIAGAHQDPRIKIYFDHMLTKLNLPISLENWVNDVPAYLKDKDFVISTSLFESFHYSIAEGMASGVLPLVHHWPGAENIYPEKYLFYTPDDCVRLVRELMGADRKELAHENREYIAGQFSLENTVRGFTRVIDSLGASPSGRSTDQKRNRLVPEAVRKSDVDLGRVSIVIPTFNRAEYLEEAIESALKQTYKNCEVIVCDDCSTDSTQFVLEKYKDRVKILSHHRNRGVSAALNSCIRAAEGDLISWLSSDDVYKPEKVEKQIRYLHEHPEIAMVYSDFDYIDERSNVTGRANVKPLENPLEDLWNRNPINGCSAMFRKSCLERTGWFDEGLGGRRGYTADGAMWHKIAYFYDIAYMDEPLLYYRVHDDNVANSIDTEKHWDIYRGYMKNWFDAYEQNKKLVTPRKPFVGKSNTKKSLNIAWIGVIDPGGISAMFKKAVERYTPHKMRIVTHTESRGFDSDIVLKKTAWGGEEAMTDFSEVQRVAEEADVLLFSAAVAPGVSQFDSQYRDTDDVPFGPIDWRVYTKDKRCAVFFYGSTSIRRNYQFYLDLYREKGWPIITCQPDIHRNMPGSTYTPILIDLENPRYHREIEVGDQITVIHSPTDRPIKNTDIYESVDNKISAVYPNVSFRLCENMGFDEAINLKRQGNIAFDQLQIGDGYYCLSSVENSALGMVNIVHMDDFGKKVIANSIGTNELPWYTPSTESEVYHFIRDLVSNPKDLEHLQKKTYDWFRKWWHEKDLIRHLSDFLEKV